MSFSITWPAWIRALVLRGLVRFYSDLGRSIVSDPESTDFSHYNYPGIYQPQDFHHCGTSGDDIQQWDDRNQVQNCELANLAECASLRESRTYTVN